MFDVSGFGLSFPFSMYWFQIANITSPQLRDAITSQFHVCQHTNDMAASSSDHDELDTEMSDIPQERDSFVQTLKQDLENAKNSLNKLETSVQSLIDTQSPQATELQEAEARAVFAEAELKKKETELVQMRKNMQEKVEHERDRHLIEYERMNSQLQAWVPAVRLLLSNTTWPKNEAEVRPLLLMKHLSWDEDARRYDIAAATDMSSTIFLPPEPYLATDFAVQHEKDPKFWTLMRWFHTVDNRFDNQDLVTIQLEWMESQPAAEDGWFLLLLKVYLERQLRYYSGVEDSLRMTILMALIWQLSNVFDARGLSEMFDGQTDHDTIRQIQSAALTGLLPFVMFARMKSALDFTNHLPAGFERDVEACTLRDYLSIVPAGGSFVESITDQKLLPLWRTMNTYVFSEADDGTRLVIIWDLTEGTRAHKVKVSFTVKGAVTTFNPHLFVKVHALTGVMTLRCSAHSPGFEIKESDTLWNWTHAFFEYEAVRAMNDFEQNVVRRRREATNMYGTLEKAIEEWVPVEEYEFWRFSAEVMYMQLRISKSALPK